ncbi:hypothetical protein AGMMS4952_10940 [Spirochaetia bacterium]|nr:hypothetical protein AGMMS4952_10940 [Spirochaetia bacterium]
MKNVVIQNQYDGPKVAPKKNAPATFSLDYVNSGDAAEIDTGIRETIKGIRLSILAMGVGLAKIKAQGLYIDLQYHSMAKYIEALCEETQMDRSSIHNWLYIGEAYVNYRKDLEKIGFSDADGPTKLPYVGRALAVYQKKDVFKAVKEMSLRQFIAFSRGEAPGPKPESKVRVKGNQLFIGDRPAVTLDEGLDPKTRAYLERVIVEAGNALEAGEVILPVRLYDMDELRRFERGADRMLKEMRINYKGKK